MLTTKIKITKTINKLHKNKSDPSNNKKTMTTKDDSITEIQVSDLDASTEIEDNDSIEWRNLPEITLASEDSDICDMDETEGLDDNFHQQVNMVSNL